MTWLNVVAAAICYGSAVWGATFYFRAEDRGSLIGKRVISVIGGICMPSALLILATADEGAAFSRASSSGLFLLSTALFWWTWWTTRRDTMQFAFSDHVPSRMRMTGPYGLVRHPYYSSYVVGWFALVVAVPIGVTFGIFVFMTCLYSCAACREEGLILRSQIAPAYQQYMKVVGRLIPSPWLRLRRL